MLNQKKYVDAAAETIYICYIHGERIKIKLKYLYIDYIFVLLFHVAIFIPVPLVNIQIHTHVYSYNAVNGNAATSGHLCSIEGNVRL